MKKVELLAPAGSLEKAKIAFMYGADAIYVGTAKLSLRSRASVDEDDLEEIITYAHNLGKKVYVALNIYASDTDYDEIEKQLNKLKVLHPDGILASDPGVIDEINRICPEIDLHISTQANTVSLHSARFWQKFGAKRVVLSRELSKEQIEYIMENKPKELEVEMFIHGAICYAYSGRCYLSHYLAGRSANCGDCAQPCRWEYRLSACESNNTDSKINIDYDEHGTYLFSSKDMCLIRQIPTIIDMGVDSLKIEGRLKTDYYLATVVRVYRKAIDEYMKLKEENREDEYDYTKYLKELDKVKTRGLSEFYFSNSNNQDIHDYDGKSENLDYEYGAKVLEKVDKDRYLVEIKNKLTVGDRLEILMPDSIEETAFNITKLYDVKSKEEIDTVNPGIKGQQVEIVIPYDLEAGTIIRRKR